MIEAQTKLYGAMFTGSSAVNTFATVPDSKLIARLIWSTID